MLKKINNKFVWVDKEKSPELQEKIDKHINYLNKCKIEDSAEFGMAYKVTDPIYWK